jgi:hypothetical protein
MRNGFLIGHPWQPLLLSIIKLGVPRALIGTTIVGIGTDENIPTQSKKPSETATQFGISEINASSLVDGRLLSRFVLHWFPNG